MAEQSIEMYWTRKQVAHRVHGSIDAVNKWLATGKLTKTKAGGKTLISESDLQRFLKESTEQAAA